MGVLRRRGTGGAAATEARIRTAIDALRPLLGIDACALELLEFREETGLALLRVHGACPDCSMSVTVFMQGIEANLRSRIPEIRAVQAVTDDNTHHGNG